jgi:hypothetical protein
MSARSAGGDGVVDLGFRCGRAVAERVPGRRLDHGSTLSASRNCPPMNNRAIMASVGG